MHKLIKDDNKIHQIVYTYIINLFYIAVTFTYIVIFYEKVNK